MRSKQAARKGNNAGNQFAKIDEILSGRQQLKWMIIPVLQDVQEAYGYLSRENIEYIGAKMDIPVNEIYGYLSQEIVGRIIKCLNPSAVR